LHIASVYYINDDYTGGEINFPDHNLKIKPKANSFITFPSNSDYWHEVLENTGKERYSSTLWFHFDGSSTDRPKKGMLR
jgi:predicted 2-oxoglutarate/Fe(II)-dependent dioxygenase YbiX